MPARLILWRTVTAEWIRTFEGWPSCEIYTIYGRPRQPSAC